MSNIEIEESLDIKFLLSKDKYVIPIYQRSYAWGKAEISQLIRDINEFESENYYLGALTCFKRENGTYELIDGQQRHTTITLINAFLKLKHNPEALCSSNLKFDSRKNAQQFLEDLHTTDNFEKISIPGIQNFKEALAHIEEEFQQKDIGQFAEKFYNKVKIFRVEVPQDTDLNHYFEIMNNRGEQLEKHEVVKALFIGKIKNDNKNIEKKEQELFATIWDACSDMSNYVFLNFDEEYRAEIFSEQGKFLQNDFASLFGISSSNEKMPQDNGIQNDDNGPINKEIPKENEDFLCNIIEDYKIDKNFPNEDKPQKVKYRSIIDFPNFLLQVLKINNHYVSLDDKMLMKQFQNHKKADSKQFAYDLLKYRIIFDKYIIKQDLSDDDENKQNWGIRTLSIIQNPRKAENKYSSTKTFENDEELVKLQTMLYYSNPSNNNNNWLQDVLKYEIFNSNEINDTILKTLTKAVFSFAKSRFKSTSEEEEHLSEFLKNKLRYPQVSGFNIYFIDFLLWKLYKQDGYVSDELKSLKDKINNKKGSFNNFKFKQVNSKEHLFPQANVYQLDEDLLNGIGNLCLISASQNSEGTNRNPTDKKELFKNDNSSLKRLIMFESYKNDKWGKEEIKNHEKEIQNLLMTLYSANID